MIRTLGLLAFFIAVSAAVDGIYWMRPTWPVMSAILMGVVLGIVYGVGFSGGQRA